MNNDVTITELTK